MLRWLAISLAMAAAAPEPAAAHSAATKGTSVSKETSVSRVHDARAALRSGATGNPGVRAGSPTAGAYALPRLGGHESSGWYQHSFGGTLNPGWGYNFGPNLGGLGR
jgi:hypothetical protein